MAGQWTAVGGYTNLVNATSAGAKTEIQAQIDKLKALITLKLASTAGSASSPEFDRLPPALAKQLEAECDALKACVAAGA